MCILYKDENQSDEIRHLLLKSEICYYNAASIIYNVATAKIKRNDQFELGFLFF